jgi:hypothetical protein
MHRAHLRLELTPRFHTAVEQSWRGQVVEHRLLALGGVFGLVTLALASAAGYFRLDELTGGQYRRRLKLAALALIAAGGTAVGALIS